MKIKFHNVGFGPGGKPAFPKTATIPEEYFAWISSRSKYGFLVKLNHLLGNQALIGKSTMACLTGVRVLKSWYKGVGGENKDSGAVSKTS